MQLHPQRFPGRRQQVCAALLCALAASSAIVSAFSTGSGTCVATAAAAAQMGTPSAGTGDYAFSLSAGPTLPTNRYLPGQPATLTLSGTQPFKGLLLYAEDAQGNRVGGFTSFNLMAFRLIDACPGPADATLTHNSSVPKAPSQAFTWAAPATDVGPVTFRAIVLRGFNDYFVL